MSDLYVTIDRNIVDPASGELIAARGTVVFLCNSEALLSRLYFSLHYPLGLDDLDTQEEREHLQAYLDDIQYAIDLLE